MLKELSLVMGSVRQKQQHDATQWHSNLEEHGQQKQHRLNQAAASMRHLRHAGENNTAVRNEQQQELYQKQQQIPVSVATRETAAPEPRQGDRPLGVGGSKLRVRPAMWAPDGQQGNPISINNDLPRRDSRTEVITAIRVATMGRIKPNAAPLSEISLPTNEPLGANVVRFLRHARNRLVDRTFISRAVPLGKECLSGNSKRAM